MTLPLAAFDPNAFHIVGFVFGIWALIVSFLGARTDFPRTQAAERVVVVISALLLVATVGAAIGTSEKHGAHESSHGDRENPTHEGEEPENIRNE